MITDESDSDDNGGETNEGDNHIYNENRDNGEELQNIKYVNPTSK